jgi:hypothetical protein
MLAVVTEQLGQLREVGIAREGFLDGLPVKDVGVGGQLNPMIRNATAQIQHEVLSVLACALAHKKRRDELGVRVERNKNPRVSEFGGIVLPNVPGLLGHKHPDFIALNSTARQLPHTRVQQLFTALASQDKQPHDGIALQPSEPFGRADRAALKQTLNRLQPRLELGCHRGPRQFRVGFAKGGFAGSAAPTHSALAKVPEALAGRVVTTGAAC